MHHLYESPKLPSLFLLTLFIAYAQMNQPTDLSRLQELSERTGIEMIVIDEAEKIAGTQAEHFKRWMIGSSYANDPLQSTIHQQYPRTKTVLLPGISFPVDRTVAEQVVDSLNKKFAYRTCITFISDDRRNDKKFMITLLQSFDKYDSLRLQETSGGSYLFSTDALIAKLQAFEQKYPFHFVGVGNDWLTLKSLERPDNWMDFTLEIMKVCPIEEGSVSMEEMTKAFQKEEGKVFMWWD